MFTCTITHKKLDITILINGEKRRNVTLLCTLRPLCVCVYVYVFECICVYSQRKVLV